MTGPEIQRPIDTERLRALIDASTPGPWGWRGDDNGSIELRGDGPFGPFDGRVLSALRSQPCIVALHDESVALAYDAFEADADAHNAYLLSVARVHLAGLGWSEVAR